MKKIMLLSFCAIALMACKKNNDTNPFPYNEEGITFDITTRGMNNPNNIRSKVPVYSQETNVHVTNVKVYAFKSDGTDYLYVKTFNITGWTDGLTFKRFVVPDTSKLPQGDYKFLAVGRNTTDNYTLTGLTPTTNFDDMAVTVSASGNEGDIYSGYSHASISGPGTRVSIDMKRKVAGVMGFFKNVPQMLNGQTVKYLRLSVTTTNQSVNLVSGSGIPTAVAPFNIIDIDLSQQAVVNGIYVGNNLISQGVVKDSATQLGGMYLMPVSTVTMILGLYDASGVAIKTWSVINGPSNTFSLEANNLYTLGRKIQAGNTNGGTTDSNDDDEPIDLLTDQALAITITPAWDVINNLAIQ